MHIDNIFGTDGIRRNVGQYPLDSNGIKMLVYALMNVIDLRFFSVVIGCDTRESCSDIKSFFISELGIYGIKVFSVGIIPTPVLAFLTRENRVDLGIMITASHNSAKYNGVKIFSNSGSKLKLEDELKISNLMTSLYIDEQCCNILRSKSLSYSLNSLKNIEVNQYFSSVFKIFEKKIELPENFRIVIDYANGASIDIFSGIIRKFIKDENIFEFNNTPNGYNINEKSGTLNAEFIREKTIECNADLGIAFDGDGDRISICLKNGYIVGGNLLLATIFWYQNKKYSETKFVSTILANGNLEKFLLGISSLLYSVDVGDRNISNMLKQENCFTGGEPSGHIILPESKGVSDAIIACLKVLEIISDAVDKEIWVVRFENIPLKLVDIEYKTSPESILNNDSFIAISNSIVESLSGNGRFIVRKSGTENVIRIYIESTSKELIDRISSDIVNCVESIVISDISVSEI